MQRPVHRPVRLVAIRALAVLLAVICLSVLLRTPTWTVIGDSMAPHLLGPHLQVECPDCGHRFTSSVAPLPETATCAVCGRREIFVSKAPLRRGRQVVVEEDVHSLRRLQLAAYQGEDGRTMVKRLVGLPGESIVIRCGDLWINGKPLQKSLAQLREQAVLVHDSRHVSPMRGPRWQDEPSGSWSRSHGGLGLNRGRGRLTYHHRTSFDGPSPPTEPSQIYDHYAHNTLLSRSLHPVEDLLLECRLQVDGPGSLAVSLDTANSTVNVLWDLARGSVTWSGGMESGVLAVNGGWNTLHVARCDQQFVVGLNGRPVLVAPMPTVALSDGSTQPWKLDFQQLRVRIAWLKVWRDLYYYSPPGARRQWNLQSGQWLLLGDNPPVSLDSRRIGPIPSHRLVGRVIP